MLKEILLRHTNKQYWDLCGLLFNQFLPLLIFTVIFGKLAAIPTDNIPPVLFYMCGITCWNYFFGKPYQDFKYLYVKCKYFWKSVFSKIDYSSFCNIVQYYKVYNSGIYFSFVFVLLLLPRSKCKHKYYNFHFTYFVTINGWIRTRIWYFNIIFNY